jgi:hypothetical protein
VSDLWPAFFSNLLMVGCREIEDHLGVLGRYAVLEPVPSDVNATANIKRWLRQTEQALSAEMIAKELPEVNQKIMLSLQKFMVRMISDPSDK